MTARPRQLAFDLSHRPALGAEDFMVSTANASALEIVDRWPDWPHWAVVVEGPARSGKSHLANVWRYRSSAEVVRANEMHESLALRFRAAKALVVENLEDGVNDEQMLFHLLNIAREHKLSILLTSRTAPGDLQITFPDLRSRLRALPLVRIEPPDEDLLRAVLLKHFGDRQLTVEPQVIDHLVTHMERSFEAAHGLVAEIDRQSLADKRRVTRTLATAIMQSWGTPPRPKD
jgi:chromosomal replication initiation ATPase DnaA